MNPGRKRGAIVFVILSAAWCIATAQVPYPQDRFEVVVPSEDRLEIEVVPVIVFDSSIREETDESAIARIERTLYPKIDELFATVHEALGVLGVGYWQYTLVYGNHGHFLVCEEATTYSQQSCEHGDLGTITDLRNFIEDLHDNEAPPKSTVQLNVVILEDKLAWRGLLGVASWWYWGEEPVPHWSARACRAWALLSTPVIAHELGHCFGLKHNENDEDQVLDLMVSYYTHYRWVKESNKTIVQNHFRYPVPEDDALGFEATLGARF